MYTTHWWLVTVQLKWAWPGSVTPRDNVAGCWPQQHLSAVLGHRPGHWVTYRKVAQQWYCLDSGRPSIITRANPFAHQNMQTIELLVFKEWYKVLWRENILCNHDIFVVFFLLCILGRVVVLNGQPFVSWIQNIYLSSWKAAICITARSRFLLIRIIFFFSKNIFL